MRLCELPLVTAELSLDGLSQVVDLHLSIYRGQIFCLENCQYHRLQARSIFLNGPHLELDFMDLNWLDYFTPQQQNLPLVSPNQAPLWQGKMWMLSSYFTKIRGAGEQGFESAQLCFQRLPTAGKIKLQAQLGPCLSQGRNFTWPAFQQLQLSFEIADSAIDTYFLDAGKNQAYRQFLKVCDDDA